MEVESEAFIRDLVDEGLVDSTPRRNERPETVHTGYQIERQTGHSKSGEDADEQCYRRSCLHVITQAQIAIKASDDEG